MRCLGSMRKRPSYSTHTLSANTVRCRARLSSSAWKCSRRCRVSSTDQSSGSYWTLFLPNTWAADGEGWNATSANTTSAGHWRLSAKAISRSNGHELLRAAFGDDIFQAIEARPGAGQESGGDQHAVRERRAILGHMAQLQPFALTRDQHGM